VSIALAKDNIDPNLSAMSVGNIGSTVDGQVIRFIPQSNGTSNRAFADVSADGQIYCYDGDNTTVILQLINSNHLMFDTISSSCNNNLSFSNNAVSLQR